MKIPIEIVSFFKKQHFFVISTIDKNGYPHASCKDIVQLGEDGEAYLLDLYKGKTYKNLKHNSHISITAVDEHKFLGYCLKGRAKMLQVDKLEPHLVKKWEDKIANRITHRFLRNIRGEKGHDLHPEARLPRPKYLISVKVSKIIDLSPGHLKQKRNK